MRGASPAGRHYPYTSLMARLAALAEGRDVGAYAEQVAKSQRERRRIATKYFSCGFIASLALGVVAILPAVLAHPGARAARGQGIAVATNIDSASMLLWPAHGTIAPDAEIGAFELPIRRSERTNAAFPVEVIGGGAARDGMTVVLRDMPESAYLSKGQRRDANTWLLRPADLNNLRLSIYEGTPDAFDVTIEVATAGGDPVARSVARVRLLDPPASPEPSVAAVDTFAVHSPQQTVEAAITPRREVTPAKPRPLETAPQQKAAQKPRLVQAPRPVRIEELRVVPRTARPEGMTSLGMATRDLDADDRQLWWRMPSSWAGSVDLPGGN